MRLAALGLTLALACMRAQAAIVVDGKLDEPEWQQAQRLEAFKLTDPYTQAEPPMKTVALVYADASGLYLGFICDQPPGVERIRTHGQRDQFLNADRVNAMIDFDGSGTTAYEFTGFLGGSEKMDAIISRQTSYNYDWDGEWQYAVTETATQWFVEYHIPWTVAPLGTARGGKRTIGLFASRVVASANERYSQPANAFMRATFVADMQKLTIPAFDQAQLDVYPYGAVSRDILGKTTQGRAGLDLFWKPSGTQQLTATVNPDFGQVESDQLVVNFTAIPTFFPDKRPFFTENLGLFNTDINVLYTRRIGAAPDCSPQPCTPTEGASNILGALKYTGSSNDALAYGAIAAFEDNTGTAKGRDFYVARARDKLSDALTVGWMGTHVERPSLDRSADAEALDFAWTLSPGVTLRSQGVVTHVVQQQPGFFDPQGTGAATKTTFGYAPGGALESTTYLVSKSQGYNVNDAGYQQRPSEYAIQNINTWFWRDFPKDDALQQMSVSTNLLVHSNDSGDLLPTTFIGNVDYTRRDTRAYGFEYDLLNAGGQDDVITCGADAYDPSCGHAPARTPARNWMFAYYSSPKSGLFRYLVVPGFGTGYYRKSGYWDLRIEPGLYPSDQLFFTSVLHFIQSPDELVSWGGPVLGTFEYEQQDVSLDANWFPADRHSLRVKFQWSAYSLDPIQAYRSDAGAHLQPSADVLNPLSSTTTALQLRYRWEFAPQSEFFAVYTHGGFDYYGDDEPGLAERNLGSSFRRGLAHETDSRFLVKVRYRFAVL